MYADRLLHGQLPYKDFFQFTPPGVDLAFAGVFAVFGERVWVADAVVVVLGMALGGVCFRIASEMMGRAEAALATAIFTVFVYGEALNATHHWWSVLGVMAAVAALVPTFSLQRFGAAGALLGVSSLFTQSHAIVALVAIAGFAAWHARRERLPRRNSLARQGALLGGFAAVSLPLGAYLVLRVGSYRVWSSLVVYVWRTMRQPVSEWTLGLPEPLTGGSPRWLAPYLVVYAMVPVAYLLALVCSLTEFVRVPTPAFYARALTWMVGLALFAEVLPVMDWVRLYAVAQPAVILFVWVLTRPVPAARAFRAVATMGVVVVGVILVRSTYRNHSEVVDLPGGRVATNAKGREKVAWLADRLAPGEEVFFPMRSSLYLPLAVHNPIFLGAAVPGRQATPELVRRAIEELEALRVVHVLWSPALEAPQAGQSAEGVPALGAYVHGRYRLEKAFADGDELWVRR